MYSDETVSRNENRQQSIQTANDKQGSTVYAIGNGKNGQANGKNAPSANSSSNNNNTNNKNSKNANANTKAANINSKNGAQAKPDDKKKSTCTIL